MPKKIAIIVDSASGLSKVQAAEQGLHFQPLQIIHEGEETLNDGVDIEKERFYELIEKGDKLTTSQASIGENLKMVEELLATHDQVISIPISSGLSSAYSTWKAVEEQIEHGRLHVIDGKNICTGIVDLANKIRQQAESGKSIESIDKFAEEYGKNTYGLLVCNDFQRLVKGGRLNAFKGAIASLLKLHVLIEFFEGKLGLKDKSRSQQKLIDEIKPLIYKKLKITANDQINLLTFLHTFPKKNEKMMAEAIGKIKRSFGTGVEINVQPLPAVVACHVGLNAFAVFVNKKIDK